MKKSRSRAQAASADSASVPESLSAPPASSARPSGDGTSGKDLSPEERYRLIAEAAYRRAEERGFVGGDPVADWLEAEREVDGATGGADTRREAGRS